MAKKDKVEEVTTETALTQLIGGGGWNFSLMFQANVTALTTQQVAMAWLLVDVLEDASKGRKEALRAALLEECEKRGIETDKGHFLLSLDGAEVTRQKRQGKAPDADAIEALLAKQGIHKDKCFDLVTRSELNISRLESLVAEGYVKKEDVEAARKVTWALDVKPEEKVEDQLKVIQKQLGAGGKKKK